MASCYSPLGDAGVSEAFSSVYVVDWNCGLPGAVWEFSFQLLVQYSKSFFSALEQFFVHCLFIGALGRVDCGGHFAPIFLFLFKIMSMLSFLKYGEITFKCADLGVAGNMFVSSSPFLRMKIEPQ